MTDTYLTPLSTSIFDGRRAENRLESKLVEMGLEWDSFSFDEYDDSIELHDVEDDIRLTPEMLMFLGSEAKFSKVYVNHCNKWETHYDFLHHNQVEPKDCPEWRVSYHHKREDQSDRMIWLEQGIPESWKGKYPVKARIFKPDGTSFIETYTPPNDVQ